MNIKSSIMKNAINESNFNNLRKQAEDQEDTRQMAARQKELDQEASNERFANSDFVSNRSEPTVLTPPTGRIPTPSDRINQPRVRAEQAVSASNEKFEKINQTTSPTVVPTKNEIADIANGGDIAPKTELKIENITSSIPDTKHAQIEQAAAQKMDLPSGFSWDGFWKDPMSQLKMLDPMQVAGVVGLIIGGIGMFKMIKNWWRRKKTKSSNIAQPTQQRAASINTETHFSIKPDKDNKYDKHTKKFNAVYSSVMTEIEKGKKK